MDRTLYNQYPLVCTSIYSWYFTPSYGQCPSDSPYWLDRDVKKLGECIYQAFEDQNVGANFMWNFKTQIAPRWSYMDAYKLGWIPPVPTEPTSFSQTN
jgi:glucan 1,3-beta-glucosidase